MRYEEWLQKKIQINIGGLDNVSVDYYCAC